MGMGTTYFSEGTKGAFQGGSAGAAASGGNPYATAGAAAVGLIGGLMNAPAIARKEQRENRLSALTLSGAERGERLAAMQESQVNEAEKERKRRERRLKMFQSGVSERLMARMGE
jgi:hypothetical protein